MMSVSELYWLAFNTMTTGPTSVTVLENRKGREQEMPETRKLTQSYNDTTIEEISLVKVTTRVTSLRLSRAHRRVIKLHLRPRQ